MTLIVLNHTGHTEQELDTEAMIAALEREMNGGGKVIVAEAPGAEPAYLRTPADARDLAPDARVTVMPQLMGG